MGREYVVCSREMEGGSMPQQPVNYFLKALSESKISYVLADQGSAKNLVVLLLRQLSTRSLWYLDPVVHLEGLDAPVLKLEPHQASPRKMLSFSDFGRIKGGHGFHLYAHSDTIQFEHSDSISIGSRSLQIPKWSTRPCVRIDVQKSLGTVSNTDDFVASAINNQIVIHKDRGGFLCSGGVGSTFQMPILDYPEEDVKEEKVISPQEELARVTEKLYDVRHKKAAHDPRALLKRFKELTGRDHPGFYA
jgi:hypothetical protein